MEKRIEKILVPIDYSEISINALKYALQLNKHYNAKMYLLHVFDMPLSADNEDYLPFDGDYNAYKKQNEEKLLHIIDQYKDGFNYAFEVCTTSGGHYIEIKDFAEQRGIDMIVIGNKGIGGMTRWLFGSVAKYVLTHANIPVLSVPLEAKFNGFEKILLIIDEDDFLEDVNIDFLKKTCERFNAKLEIGLIFNNRPDDEKYRKSFLQWMDIVFKIKPHIIETEDDSVIIKNINELATSLNVSLVITVPHAHKWIDTLFFGKHCEKNPPICQMPLMTLPVNAVNPD